MHGKRRPLAGESFPRPPKTARCRRGVPPPSLQKQNEQKERLPRGPCKRSAGIRSRRAPACPASCPLTRSRSRGTAQGGGEKGSVHKASRGGGGGGPPFRNRGAPEEARREGALRGASGRVLLQGGGRRGGGYREALRRHASPRVRRQAMITMIVTGFSRWSSPRCSTAKPGASQTPLRSYMTAQLRRSSARPIPRVPMGRRSAAGDGRQDSSSQTHGSAPVSAAHCRCVDAEPQTSSRFWYWTKPPTTASVPWQSRVRLSSSSFSSDLESVQTPASPAAEADPSIPRGKGSGLAGACGWAAGCQWQAPPRKAKHDSELLCFLQAALASRSNTGRRLKGSGNPVSRPLLTSHTAARVSMAVLDE
mmetsp:Transcript_2795/g.6509  ORF Transcript_2795/g.6509 Transcript_2795/m.6509 type:complete len:364 (-) Transcript_2795:955-2046(-)